MRHVHTGLDGEFQLITKAGNFSKCDCTGIASINTVRRHWIWPLFSGCKETFPRQHLILDQPAFFLVVILASRAQPTQGMRSIATQPDARNKTNNLVRAGDTTLIQAYIPLTDIEFRCTGLESSVSSVFADLSWFLINETWHNSGNHFLDAITADEDGGSQRGAGIQWWRRDGRLLEGR